MNFYLSKIISGAKESLRFFRRHLKKTIAGFVVLFFAWAAYAATRPKQPEYVTQIAERTDLRQLVEAVGTIISDKDLELQFPSVDIVMQVYVKEGDKVKAGQRLTALRSGSLAAAVTGASAAVQSAQAQLRELQEGSRPEDIAIIEAQVANKRASLEAVKQTLLNSEENIRIANEELAVLEKEARTSLSGEVGTSVSTALQYLASAKTALQVTQGVFNSNEVNDAVVKNLPSGYDTLIVNLKSSLERVSSLLTSSAPADYQKTLRFLGQVRTEINMVSDVENRAYDILSNLSLTSYFTNTSRETNKTTLATQKANVQTALSTMDSTIKSLQDSSAAYDTKIVTKEGEIRTLTGNRDKAKADIATYETSLQIDQASLALKKAPARQTDLDTAAAKVRQAQADLARAAANFNDTILTATVDGVITHVNVKTGEVRPSALPAVTMIGLSPYRIEMFVSEVDIPKVDLSQSGAIKLDAFPDRKFQLRAGEVDGASTDKDGVPKYRIKLDFVFPHDELKIGMTGDAEIITGEKDDVVIVPLRAVLQKADGAKYVRVLKKPKDAEFEERTVITGLEGEGGNIEVEGVEEGETVIVLIKQ